MIRISEQALSALTGARLDALRDEVATWLGKTAPRAGLGQPPVEACRAAADRALAVCLPRDIGARHDICRIALRCLAHGPDYPSGDAHAVALRILDSADIAAHRKVLALKLVETGHLPPGGPWHV